MNTLPVATQWLINSIGQLNHSVPLSVALIIVRSTGRKGTGWLVSEKHIVTNEHVIHGGAPKDILVTFPDGSQFVPIALVDDPLTDLAALTLPSAVPQQPLPIDASGLAIG